MSLDANAGPVYIAGDICRSAMPKPAPSSTIASATCSQLSPALF